MLETQSLYMYKLSRNTVSIVPGWNVSVKMKPTLIKKENPVRVNYTLMNGLRKPVAEISPATRVT
jgi:hypothetical protein